MTTQPIIPIVDFFNQLSGKDPSLTMKLAGGMRLTPHADAANLGFLLLSGGLQPPFMGWTGQVFTVSYDPKGDKAELRGYHFTPRNDYPSSHFEMLTLSLVYNGHSFRTIKAPGTSDLYTITKTIQATTAGEQRRWIAERYREAFKLAKSMGDYRTLLRG